MVSINMIKPLLATFISSALLIGGATCMANTNNAISSPSQAFEHIKDKANATPVDHNSNLQNMRNSAIKQAALTYGASAGELAEWNQIEKALFKRVNSLNQVFNFKMFYLDGEKLQPPVLNVNSDVSNITNKGRVYTNVQKVYRVISPAQFKSKPLTWEDFLLPDQLPQLVEPQDVLLPQNNDEAKLWKTYIVKGWKVGQNRALESFDFRLASLNSAFQGMALYVLLRMQGMIEPPQVMVVKNPVSGSNNGDELALQKTIHVITKTSYFVQKPNTYKPLVLSKKLLAGVPNVSTD